MQGESGTGKDLIAKAIHYQSRRQEKPFVAINCSAIPETLMEAELFGHERGAFTDAKAMKKGLFEMADGGTLFLDEIGELSPLLQAKLLRVLEDQIIRRVGGVRDMQVDVRVIAASNRDLERAVRDSTVPPGPVLPAGHHLDFSAAAARTQRRHPAAGRVLHRSLQPQVPQDRSKGITDDTRKLMMKYDWPGNVRELKNAVERAMILEDGNDLQPDYLPFAVAQQQSAYTAFELSSGTQRSGSTGNAIARRPQPAEARDSRRRHLAGRSRTRVGGDGDGAGQRQSDARRPAARHQPRRAALQAEEVRPDSRRRRRALGRHVLTALPNPESRFPNPCCVVSLFLMQQFHLLAAACLRQVLAIALLVTMLTRY